MNESGYFIKVNNFFEYTISEEYVDLHLQGDFHDMFEELGKRKASAIIAKKLIEAVTIINNKRSMGDLKLKKCSSIHMRSPIFYAPTFYFKSLRNQHVRDKIKIESPICTMFRLLGIKTDTYTIDELKNPKFVQQNKEAQIAVKDFGPNKDVGIVDLPFDKFNSKGFQEKLRILNKVFVKLLGPNKEERELY